MITKRGDKIFQTNSGKDVAETV